MSQDLEFYCCTLFIIQLFTRPSLIQRAQFLPIKCIPQIWP